MIPTPGIATPTVKFIQGRVHGMNSSCTSKVGEAAIHFISPQPCAQVGVRKRSEDVPLPGPVGLNSPTVD